MKHLNFLHTNRRLIWHKTRGLTVWIAAVGLLSACSTSAWYEGMKMRAQTECDRQAPSAREACLSRLNHQSYDAYQKARAPITP